MIARSSLDGIDGPMHSSLSLNQRKGRWPPLIYWHVSFVRKFLINTSLRSINNEPSKVSENPGYAGVFASWVSSMMTRQVLTKNSALMQ